MSAFDDFNTRSFADSATVFGTETFTIGGLAGDFTGILNEYGSEIELMIGGKSGTYTATLVCEPDQFDELDGPLERTLYGREITLDGRTFKITRCALDATAITIGLTNPSKGR